jgi:CheY-like chemotaxis protein
MVRAEAHLEPQGEHLPVVLVVEDEPLVRLWVADYLRDIGYRVLEAGNAEEATAMLLAGEPIEVVFSDVGLPGRMGGISLSDWIRQTFPHVYVILTSAQSEVRARLNAAQPIPFIPKPYEPQEVAQQISSLLSHPPARDAR